MLANRKFEKWTTIVLFLFPACAGLIVFSVIPIIYSMVISITDWNGLNPWNLAEGTPSFIGMTNFKVLLASAEFWRSLRNTLYFIVTYLPLMLVVSIGMAVLLNNTFRGISVYRVLFFIPVLTSWVAGALIWKWLLSRDYGPINEILSWVGIQGPAWLQDPVWAMPGIVFASVWKDMGFFSLILLGGIQAINPTYYEAAMIDGANFWHKFKSITLPLMSPILLFVMIISVINSFQLFPQVMIMTDAGPHGATEVMVERIYKYAFQYFRMGYASAFSWVLFFIIFFFTVLQLILQKKWVHYES